MSNTDSQRLDAMRRQRDGYRNQLRKTDIDRLRAQVDGSIMRTALVAIQELHKPVLVGTRDGEPVYRCMTCISIEVPCKTRSLADRGLGEDRG